MGKEPLFAALFLPPLQVVSSGGKARRIGRMKTRNLI